jgi:hypothetical protein
LANQTQYKKQYKKTFVCSGCAKTLEATIKPGSGVGVFFSSRFTLLSFTCPVEKVKHTLPINLNSKEYPFKRGKIVDVRIIKRQ